ncbi:MAG: cytochrome c maturation protein CcmE [Myxococcales bacterium]|nr:cytochrome c maturation protein CcmE [Myxococcales bacterium]
MALPTSSKLIIAGVIVGAVAIIALSKPSEGVLEYVYVDHLMENTARFEDRVFKVHGTVVEGSVKQKIGEAGDYTFEITRNGSTLAVHYTNMVPDTFAEGGEVVLTGKLSDAGTFESTEMAAKCPSKYEEQEQANPNG